MSVAAGRDWREGLGQAIAVGATTGLVDAAVDYHTDRLQERWVQQRAVRQVAKRAQDPAVQQAMHVIGDPNASTAQKWQAQNVLLDAGVQGVWQGGLSAEQAMGGRPEQALVPYDPEFAAAQETAWSVRLAGRTAEEYHQRGMLTDQEFMALMDARMHGLLTSEWGDFILAGSHTATPQELHMRELLTGLSEAEIEALPFAWRVEADWAKGKGPTYEDLEFWTPDKQRLPQEFFDFVYERAPTLKGKKIDWAYNEQHHDVLPSGIYFGEGGAERVPAPWARQLGEVPGTILENPQDIFYAQSTISSRHHGRRTVEDNIQGLISGEVRPADIPPIQVFMKLPFMDAWGPMTKGGTQAIRETYRISGYTRWITAVSMRIKRQG